MKKGKLLDCSRAEACTQGNLQPWFEVYEDLIRDEKYDVHLLFNLDETSVNVLDRVNKKILERTESPIIPVIRKPSRFASITLVICIAAYGRPLTSTLLWPQKSVPDELRGLRANDIAIIANSSGWQTKATFEQMMLEIYLPEMIRRRNDLGLQDKEILLILDGHHSRVSLLLLYACRRWHITILVIPAHTSSEVQPNDCRVNAVFKNCFTKECQRFMDRLMSSIIDSDLELFPVPQNTRKRSGLKGEKVAGGGIGAQKGSAATSSSSSSSPSTSIPASPSSSSPSTSIPASPSSIEEQLVFPDNLPSPIRRKSARLTKRVVIEMLKSTDIATYPLPALFDSYEYEANAMGAERERHMLVEVIPRALEKALSIDTVRSSWELSGLLPLSQSPSGIISNKESVLKRLPVGKPILTHSRASPYISGRILTTDAVLAEIWDWDVRRKVKERKDDEAEDDKLLYINSTLQEIFGIINQKEESLKHIFGSVSEIAQEDINKETKHVMQWIRDLRRKRDEDSPKPKQTTFKTESTDDMEQTVRDNDLKLIIGGKEYGFEETFTAVRKMNDDDFITYLESMKQDAQKQHLSPKRMRPPVKRVSNPKKSTRRKQHSRRLSSSERSESSSDDGITRKELSQGSTMPRRKRISTNTRFEEQTYYDESEMEILLENI